MHALRGVQLVFMLIYLQSFGIKHGEAEQGAFTISTLCLRNPHGDPGLRHLDGRDPAVAAALRYDPELPRVLREAHAALARGSDHIAFYCYGGRHRSVFVAETFARELERQGHRVRVTHQELK